MQPSTPSTLILHVCQDSQLSGTREMVLRSVGYYVESSETVDDAFRRFEVGDYDLVLVCHTISERERESLVSLIKNLGSGIPVVALESRDAVVDSGVFLTAQNEPVALLSKLNEILDSCRAQSR